MLLDGELTSWRGNTKCYECTSVPSKNRQSSFAQRWKNCQINKNKNFLANKSKSIWKCSTYLSPTIPRLIVGYPCSWIVARRVERLLSLIFPGNKSSSGFSSCTCDHKIKCFNIHPRLKKLKSIYSVYIWFQLNLGNVLNF